MVFQKRSIATASRRLSLSTSCCLLMAIGVGLAPQARCDEATMVPVSPVEREVLDFERRRCDAVLRRDARALDDMMASDVTYVHASGIKQNKAEYLAYVAAGKVTYTAYQINNPVVHVLGDTAVTHGTFKYQIGSAQPPKEGELIYTAVYVRQGGKWSLTSWEATPKVASSTK